MSVGVMSLVFKAQLPDIALVLKQRRVTAPILKLTLLALGDHANDEGEGAYPSIGTIEKKTALKHQSVLNALKALRQEGFILKAGISKRATVNYTINLAMLQSLVYLVASPNQPSIPGMLPQATRYTPPRQPGIPEPSFNHPPKRSFKHTDEKPDFVNLTVQQAVRLPELRIFHQATGRIPGSGQWETVWATIRKMNGIGNAEYLRPFWLEWAARGYNVSGLAWLTDWAVSGVIPARNQKQSYSRKSSDEPPKQLSPEEIAHLHERAAKELVPQ